MRASILKRLSWNRLSARAGSYGNLVSCAYGFSQIPKVPAVETKKAMVSREPLAEPRFLTNSRGSNIQREGINPSPTKNSVGAGFIPARYRRILHEAHVASCWKGASISSQGMKSSSWRLCEAVGNGVGPQVRQRLHSWELWGASRRGDQRSG